MIERIQSVIFSNIITWKSLLLDIVKEEGFDPWELDVGLIAEKYLEKIKKMQELDFHLSGKVILAAAILLRMKAELLEEKKKREYNIHDKIDYELAEKIAEKGHEAINPKVPLPFKRKVSLQELVNALQSALEVKKRRDIRHKKLAQQKLAIKVEINPIDITEKIKEIYNIILKFINKFKKKEIGFFRHLIPSKKREDLIWSFVPLIHLANKGEIKIRQEKLFGEIYISKKEK